MGASRNCVWGGTPGTGRRTGRLRWGVPPGRSCSSAGIGRPCWPGRARPMSMLILTETGFQVHYDHYEVGLSDNDFLPVTNKAGESYRYLALV